MDPDRVRAYLQVACAGLGFDIGEIWWTHNGNESSSALAAIQEKDESGTALVTRSQKKLRFVQLYTSKSYENRRNMLVRPADEEENYHSEVSEDLSDEESGSDLNKHVLSPTLVDAISKTAQVVWAHTRKSEGLTGRSDMRLQTAVGMPVAVDREGNMCVVVMFSPNNISSTDDAMEYLQSISRSATSATIPCLLPAFDPHHGLISLPHHHQSTNDVLPMLKTVLSDGVTTRFVSLDENPMENQQLAIPEVLSDHDLGSAPRDCFGIPMLPAVAELGNTSTNHSEENGVSVADAFDEASYGVWSTIMDTLDEPNGFGDDIQPHSWNASDLSTMFGSKSASMTSTTLATITKPFMAIERQERLQEFASAFLEVSVFDLAEVWLPLGQDMDALGLVTSVTSTKSNAALNEFSMASEDSIIKYWSGAVGRAYSSGNPVWSCNRHVFADSSRVQLFQHAKIETALSVPVFSGKSNSPAFVFCCYSFVRTGSVPFVLKFVQQALKLLWSGLDKVQPHASVGKDLWRDVAPADLGEMAADVEMQHHFMVKKRPIGAISNDPYERIDADDELAVRIETLEGLSGTPVAASIYTGWGTSSEYGISGDYHGEEIFPSPMQPIQHQTFESVQNHIHDAIQAVAEMKPIRQHLATNATGTKRAHVFHQQSSQPTYSPRLHQKQQMEAQEYQVEQGFVTPQQPPAVSENYYTQRSENVQAYEHVSPVYASQHSPTYQSQQIQASSQQQQQQSNYEAFESSSTYLNQGFLPAVSAPLPRPLPLPNQFVNSQTGRKSLPFACSEFEKTSLETYREPLSSQLQPTPQLEPGPVPDVVVDDLQLARTNFQQQHIHQPFSTNLSVPSPSIFPEPSPNPDYPILVDQRSENEKSSVAFPVHRQSATHVPAPSQQFFMPTSQAIPEASVNGKICRIQGCNEATVSRRPYCIRHSGTRMCEHEGCSKCAQGSTRFCIAHGGGRRCTVPGCDKGARDKFFCAAHGGGKRCKYDGCDKSAVGGSSLCTAHGGGRRCCVDGCDKSAQSSTKYCVKHGGGKKCCHPGCEKVARGRTQYCAAHGGGVRCKLAGCNRVAVGKLQLCRAHGGGARTRNESTPILNGGTLPPMFDDIVQKRGSDSSNDVAYL